MLDKLRNRIATAYRDGTLQEGVDAVSRAYRRARDSDIATDLRAKTRTAADRGAPQTNDMLSSALLGLGQLKGLAGHLQSGGGLLRTVNQIARELPAADRSAAVRHAVDGLSGNSRQELAARLGRQGNDPASTVIGMLEQGGGIEQVLRGLSRRHPASGALGLIEALKDPVVQELARFRRRTPAHDRRTMTTPSSTIVIPTTRGNEIGCLFSPIMP
jgi:hypothetical protein